jgi:hypothetical protein
MSYETACSTVGLKPTKRQWSKFRRGFGLAFKAASGKIVIPTEEIVNPKERLQMAKQQSAQQAKG